MTGHFLKHLKFKRHCKYSWLITYGHVPDRFRCGISRSSSSMAAICSTITGAIMLAPAADRMAFLLFELTSCVCVVRLIAAESADEHLVRWQPCEFWRVN